MASAPHAGELTRTCRDCGHTGPLEDFTKSKNGKYGRATLCIECNRRIAREWTRNNRERNAARARAWARANPEKKRAGDKRWAEENRERVNANSRDWAARNRERRREIARRSDAKHREARRIAGREYWKRVDPETKRQRQREWKAKNRDKVALDNHLRRVIQDVDVETYRAYVRVLHGDPCSYCGGFGGEIDHIVPLSAGGANAWENLTSACRSCNSSKHASPLLLWLAR